MRFTKGLIILLVLIGFCAYAYNKVETKIIWDKERTIRQLSTDKEAIWDKYVEVYGIIWSRTKERSQKRHLNYLFKFDEFPLKELPPVKKEVINDAKN